MGHANTAKRARGWQIRVYGISRQATVGNIIGPARYIAAGFGVDRTVQGICANFIKSFDLACQDTTVALEAGFNFDQRSIASSSEKHFIARQHPLNGSARFACQKRQSRFKPRVGFTAVTTADERYDDTHLILRQFENLCQLLLNTGRVLSRGMKHQLAARLPVSRRGVRFDVTMLHRRQRVCVFDYFIRFQKALFNVAVLHMINAAYIPADLKVKLLSMHTGGSFFSLRMEHRGVGLDSLEYIEHCWKLFVINFD